MNDLLKFYYNLKDVDILKIDHGFIIMDKDDYTYFLTNVDDNTNLNNALKIINNIGFRNNYGIIINNNDNSYISKINDNKYVLIKLKCIINERVTLKDMISNNLKYRDIIKTNIDLTNLWSKKIDYLEYQVSQLGNNYSELLNSFSFFIGLAENAISFLNINNINYNNTHKTLSHLRINNNELNIDYYNPLNIIIDYEIRDYAEYLKSKILITDDILKDFIYIIDNANLSIDDIKLLYARVMFPTLYFDKVEDILLNDTKEKELDIFINNISNYLNILKDIYLELNKKGISIDIPNWIIKS